MDPHARHEGPFKARYFSGEAPIGLDAEVRIGSGGLSIGIGSDHRLWPFEQLQQRRRPRHGEPVHLERAGGHEVLVLSDPAVLHAIRRAAPATAGRIRPSSRVPFLLGAALLIGGVVGAIAGITRFGIPALATSLARTIPIEWEERFGAAVVESVAPGPARVDDPEVTRLMNRLLARLSRGASPSYRYRIQVVKGAEVNALAAPGGHIVVFAGLIGFTRTPEELAGVLAHEIAHVERRHVTEGIFKRASLGFLISLVAGDPSGPASAGARMAQSLADLSFSRQAESEADAVGLEILMRAGVDPRGMPEVLDRMTGLPGGRTRADFLSSHPAPAARAGALREALARATPGTYAPLMSAGEWAALRARVLPKHAGRPAPRKRRLRRIPRSSVVRGPGDLRPAPPQLSGHAARFDLTS
jgi:predicted Zn-dependent protease